MSKLEFINASSVDQEVDAIVNAANRHLLSGGGVCGAIFSKAGYAELECACDEYQTPLRDGDAVITPAFKITNARSIIHAVGPNFYETPEAFDALENAYYNSLVVLMNNGLHSISFPLISAGIFGGTLPNPIDESTKQCINAYNRFISDYPDYEIDVKLCAFQQREMDEVEKAKTKYLR